MKKNKEKKKLEPWRIIVGSIAIIYIIFMWIKNDILDIYKTMPKEQVFPLIITTIGVTFIKIICIGGVLFIIKFIISKIRKNTND